MTTEVDNSHVNGNAYVKRGIETCLCHAVSRTTPNFKMTLSVSRHKHTQATSLVFFLSLYADAN